MFEVMAGFSFVGFQLDAIFCCVISFRINIKAHDPLE